MIQAEFELLTYFEQRTSSIMTADWVATKKKAYVLMLLMSFHIGADNVRGQEEGEGGEEVS